MVDQHHWKRKGKKAVAILRIHEILGLSASRYKVIKKQAFMRGIQRTVLSPGIKELKGTLPPCALSTTFRSVLLLSINADVANGTFLSKAISLMTRPVPIDLTSANAICSAPDIHCLTLKQLD